MKKLIEVQNELKAPKGQFNNFGKYNYRSCEDIIEAVKPLLYKHGLLLTISDKIVQMGERYYVEATATVTDGESSISVTGYAREDESKKGQDLSQLTGSTSSYARKYALNGLFAIDDTKDSDHTNDHGKGQNKPETTKFIDINQVADLTALAEEKGKNINDIMKHYHIKALKEMTLEMFKDANAILSRSK